jgi:VWFA-related protein
LTAAVEWTIILWRELAVQSRLAIAFVSLLGLLSSTRILRADGDHPSSEPRVHIEPRVSRDRTEPSAEERAATLRVDKTLVLVNVTVTDPLGRSVAGLEQESFRVFEDKVEQRLSAFSSEDAPVSVGLVFDTSGSMVSRLGHSRRAAAAFFRTANPEDEFFLVQFNDRPELAVPFTSDIAQIQQRLNSTRARGRTALLDAVYLALSQMKKARNARKALLIVSDGGDNSSRYSESQLRDIVREADVQIYAIGIFDAHGGGRRSAEELNGPTLLTEITEQTGGRHFPLENVAELPDIAEKIGIELRNQYVLGYTPSNLINDGKYRRLQVRLDQPRGMPPLKAYYRLGYYAPVR